MSIISNQDDEVVAELIHEMKVEVQAAVKRRLRDGAVLAIQSDVMISNMDIDILPHFIPLMAHLAAGLQFCFSKDRSFVDPLKPKLENGQDAPIKDGPVVNLSTDSTDFEEQDDDEVNSMKVEDDEVISIEMDDGSDSSSSDDIADDSITNTERPVVLLPNGLVIYEDVCITFSIQNTTIRGSYPGKESGYVLLTTKGCVAEYIWPKVDNEYRNEFGMHSQLSVAYLSIQDRHEERIRTMFVAGIRHKDPPSLDIPAKKPREIHVDESFPLFERRSIRDDPLDLRHCFPTQAFGIKTTIEFLTTETGDEVKFVNEIGADEINILLDADACSRIMRFASNEQGGGFDTRWYTGDWTDSLSVEMLQNPNATIDLDDHLQIPKQIFLDENFMISSDLLNVIARFTNVELRVPAAIHENVRSCDILAETKETTFVVSSALPRTFLSGKIGNSISGDNLEEKGVIDFPNDPSDIAYALEQSEDPALRQLGAPTSKNASTFRVQLTARDFQMKIAPVIPFSNANQAQQFIAPTDMTMIVCFEGEAKGQNEEIQVVLFVSIQIHRILLNIDFDLLAGSTCTALYHFDTVQSTIERMKKLSPLITEVNDDPDKVKKSMYGRQIMVRRQLIKSKAAGGLSIVFCLQQSELMVTIWRQNVPILSPFRDGQISTDHFANVDDAYIKILRLFDLRINDFEVGVEFDFQTEESCRTILKCCLEKASMEFCDVKKVMKEFTFMNSESPDPEGGYGSDTSQDYNRYMVNFLSFGVESLPGNYDSAYMGREQHFAIRLEEQLSGDSRSWSLAADLTSPATITFHVDEVKDSFVLLVEALLLPTWSERARSVTDEAPFPDRTIGALFYTLLRNKEGPTQVIKLKWASSLESGEDPAEPFVERALSTLFNLFLPVDLQLVLLRLEIANLLLILPAAQCHKIQDGGSLGILLNQSDIVVRFYPVPGCKPENIQEVLACKGVAWSELIKTEEDGFYQNIWSQQSLISITRENGTLVLINPFDIGLTYEAANMSLSMKNDLKVNDIRRIEGVLWRIQSLSNRCSNYQNEVSNLLAKIRKSAPVAKDIISEEKEESNEASSSSIRATRMLVHKIQQELGSYEKELRSLILKKDSEAESLKIKIFEKEKERFGALALLSSRVAGWVRMGGYHRTGQRVARKSMMWPYWAVLRKDLLMLFSKPGEVSFRSDLKVSGFYFLTVYLAEAI